MAWWDADPLREFITRRGLAKWSNDGPAPLGGSQIEGYVVQIADILGDWREEIVTAARGELRIYSTTIPAADRRTCLMQDPLYRSDVAHRTMGYTDRMYPMLSYYLGAR
jgi:rhamnogalacturonan endolyase